MIREFTELLLEIQMLYSIELGRIHRETVLHNVVTEPLGYLNFLTLSAGFKDMISAGKLENSERDNNRDYKDSVHVLSAKYVLG